MPPVIWPWLFSWFVLAAPCFAGPPNNDERRAITQMDELWRQRAWPGPMEEVIAIGDGLLQSTPQSFEGAWRTARASWWIGHTADDSRVKRSRCLAAMKYAETAVGLDPNRVEGHFYYAMSIGEYATTIGIGEVVWKGLGPKLEQAALKAYALDKDYNDGAPMTTLGRYYSMLPWPVQDLQRSRRYLEELRQTHPQALVGRFYLAETYYKLGEHQLALQELQFVVHAAALDGAMEVRPSPRELAAQRLAHWFPEAARPVGPAEKPDGE